MSIAFLIIFILMFIWGYKIYRKGKDTLEVLKEKAPADYMLLKKKMSPELYLKRKFATLSDEEGRLEGLPNSFVSVGILATFIGLGVAIQGAASLLNESTIDLAKMTDVLGVIAFKFQTSIWGIAFSLLFQSLLVDRYFCRKQDIWDELILELYNMEGESSRLLLERQNIMLENAFAQQLKYSQEHEARISGEINNLKASIRNATEIMENYTRASVEFVSIASDFDKDVKSLTKNVNERLKQINQTVRDIDENNHKFLTDFEEKNKDALAYILHEKEAMQKIFIRSAKEYIGDVHEAVNELLEDNRKQIHDTYHTAVENLNTVVSKVNGSIEQINKSTRNIDSSVQKMQKAITEIHKSSEVASSNMNQIIKTVGDDLSGFVVRHTNSLQAMNEKFEEITEKILDNENNHIGLLNESMKNNTELLLATSESMKKEIAQQREIFNEALDKINMNIGSFSAVLTENINNLSVVLKENGDSNVHNINAGIQKQNGVLLEGFSKISQDYTDVINEQGKYMVNEISPQILDLKEIATQMNSLLEQLVTNSKNAIQIEGRDG